MEAVEADLASADESVSSSETSVSMATAVRRTALTTAKEAKRLFCIAGALTEIEAVDPTGTKPRKKETASTGMAASSSTEAGTTAGDTLGADTGLTPKSQDQEQTVEHWQEMQGAGYWFPPEVTVQAVPKAMLAPRAKHAAKAKAKGFQLNHKFMEKLRLGSARDRKTMRERKKSVE